MKKYLFLGMLWVCFPVAAYQVGPTSRANFGTESAPAEPQNTYRSFTNSNNRNWGQGVQTKPVQTSLAGSTATEFEAPQLNEKKTSGKHAAKAVPPSNPATMSAQPLMEPVQQPPANAANGMPAADPTAMLQQVQGMMQGISGMVGENSNGQQPAAAGSQNAVPGMPNMSALMGGMMPTMPSAAPSATPTKK